MPRLTDFAIIYNAIKELKHMDKDNFHMDIVANGDKPDGESDEQLLHRLRILYLYQIFFTKTDENHGITMNEIIQELKNRGISAARKAIYADIKALIMFGLDIQAEKGSASSYRVLNRKFELPELTALADSVICSHFFPAQRARDLIGKLGTLCSEYEAKQFKHGTFVTDNSIDCNKQILINVDTIHRAVADKKQISFDYYEFVYDYSQKRPKKNSRGRHICSPIALTWDDNKYYLIAYYPKYKSISHFRIDKMEKVEILAENAEKLPQDFKLSEYMKSTFSMFSGELRNVTLRFHNSLMNAVIDRFGKINIEHDGRDHFKFTTQVRVSKGQAPATFFGWLFQFGTMAQVIEPADIREQYYEMLSSVLEHGNTDD